MDIEPLGEDFEENCERFLPEAVEQGCVWALEGEEGFALCESERHEDVDVMPFWSQREFAEAHIADADNGIGSRFGAHGQSGESLTFAGP